MPSGQHWKKLSSHVIPPEPVTGYSHPKCYAQTTNDCNKILSREHVVSESVLEELGDESIVIITGRRGQEADESLCIPITQAVAKILCSRHNSALAPLDQEAFRFIRIAKRYTAELRADPAIAVTELKLFSGPDIERWLLKVLCGVVAARQLNIEPSQVPPTVFQQWVGILFGNEPWPALCGMYIEPLPLTFIPSFGRLSLTPLMNHGGQMVGARFQLAHLSFILVMDDPAHAPVSPLWLHPSRITMVKQSAKKYLEVSWDELRDLDKEVTVTLDPS